MIAWPIIVIDCFSLISLARCISPYFPPRPNLYDRGALPNVPTHSHSHYHCHHRHSCGVWVYFVVGLDCGAESSRRKDLAPAIVKENEKERVW